MGSLVNTGIGFGPNLGSSSMHRKNTKSADIGRVPWRAQGIKYAHNEIFFDITEDIHYIVNINKRKLLHSRINGTIECLSRLSGQPTLILNLSKLATVDVGFNYNCSWKTKDKSLSFVPMDGSFKLIEY